MSRTAQTRKAKGEYGKINLRQYPVRVNDDNPRSATPPSADNDRLRLLPCGEFAEDVISPALPYMGYEKMRIQYNIDLLDLSALTSFHVSHATVRALSRQPLRLIDALRSRQWSYLDFLPSLYGDSKSLDNAALCLAARLRHYLNHPGEPPTAKTCALYSVALKALQAELDDPELRVQPHVLCATQVLGLYEVRQKEEPPLCLVCVTDENCPRRKLLNSCSGDAWVKHASGAAALIQLRGVERYETELEKALLLSQIGSIVGGL
jgi:hypothetical protein